MFIRYLYI